MTRTAPRWSAGGLAALVAVVLLAGCFGRAEYDADCWREAQPMDMPPPEPLQPAARVPDPASAYQRLGFTGSDPTGRVDAAWPDLAGQQLVILDHGAFDYAFGPAKAAFENVTHARVSHIAERDAGSLLERAVREQGRPGFDVLYGIDNVLLGRAQSEGVLAPYRPLLAPRIQPQYLLEQDPWVATPVDHGYIAVNVAASGGARGDQAPQSLADLVRLAPKFVTEDPRTSTPGLGFLLATVATFGEDCFQGYWAALLGSGALVVPDWTTAYTQHFTGGYGAAETGFSGTRDLVTSYTTSPAYEVFYGKEGLNGNLLAPAATFHQVQTMAIAAGAPHRAAAEAWVEFTLTDAFQELAAPVNAVYPVAAVDVAPTYRGLDPAPGSFQPARFTSDQLAQDVPRWVGMWRDVFEDHQAH